MTGAKSLREKGRGVLDAIQRAEQSGGLPPSFDPSRKHTAPGIMFGLQERAIVAEERAERAEAELAALRSAGTDATAIAAAEARAQVAEQALEEAKRQLEERAKTLPSQALKLDELKEVSGRKRVLTAEQFGELRENLRHNPLITPIVVRKLADGTFEIIAGHNRAQAYRELGRTEIAANVLDDADEDLAERAAFYSNLLSPSLPDYEKYLGFKARMTRNKMTITQVAEEAGIPHQRVSEIMAFDSLPASALSLIAGARDRFGSDSIMKFAKLVSAGKSEAVVAAIARVASGELTQTAGIQEAERAGPAKAKDSGRKPIIIKQGKANYCEIHHTAKIVRLSFKDAGEAEAMAVAIKELMESRVREQKS